MPNEIRILNRVAGADQSPGGTGNQGNLAVNASPASKTANNGTPKLFFSDGTAWIQLNPPAAVPSVGSTTLPGGTPGSSTGIGGAWNTLTPKPTDPIIIVNYAGTAYVKTGAGTADGDWTKLGSSASFASDAEIQAGTVTDKGIAPDQLRLNALNGPTGTAGAAAPADANHLIRLDAAGMVAFGFIPSASDAETLTGTELHKLLTPANLQSRTLAAPTATQANDHDYLVRLDANGQIDAGFLSVKGLSYRGNMDLRATYAAPVGLATGDFGTVSDKGAAHASWPGFTGGESVEVGDLVIFDGTNWHLVQHGLDTTAYVAKSGANAIINDMTMTWAAPATLTTIIDGGDPTKSQISNVLLDCGGF